MNKDLRNLGKNQKAVLQALIRSPKLSRARLAEECGVSAPAMTTIAKKLISKKLILQAGRGDNKRGQPQIQLRINSDSVYSLGVFIERDSLSFTLIDILHNVRHYKKVTGDFSEPKSTTKVLVDSIHKIFEIDPRFSTNLMGLGIAITGNFVTDRKTVVPPDDMSAWHLVDYQKLLVKDLDIPIFIENDAAAAALGELYSSLGKRFSSFFYLHMGNGLGGGYVLNSRPIRGAYGNSAEIGHLLRHPICRPTLKNLNEFLGRSAGKTNFDEIEYLFEIKDERFMTWLNKSIENLQQPINSVAVLLDPEAIIFGGRFPNSVIEYIRAKIEIECYDDGWQDVPRPVLKTSENKSANSAAFGAATLPLYDFFKKDVEN